MHLGGVTKDNQPKVVARVYVVNKTRTSPTCLTSAVLVKRLQFYSWRFAHNLRYDAVRKEAHAANAQPPEFISWNRIPDSLF